MGDPNRASYSPSSPLFFAKYVCQFPWRRPKTRFKRTPTKGAFGAARSYGQKAVYPRGRFASF